VAEVVLDASALLAFLQREPGLDRVRAVLPEAVIGSVNFAEVVTKLVQWGAPAEHVAERLGDLDLDVQPFDRSLALSAGALHAETRRLGLSLGDRSCLALARSLGAPVLTADRAWQRIDLGIEIELIR
jgi:PIN domain nuclease of toxin-antitoxin system